MTKEERIEKAVSFFKEGYNCSQSVVAAYADLYGFTREQALHMAASFGGGIGRMRETCGAACGMFLLAGLERCAVEGSDREGKGANYALVQELAARFKEKTGSIRCADLLGLTSKDRDRIYSGRAYGSVLCQASLCGNGAAGSNDLGRFPGKRA